MTSSSSIRTNASASFFLLMSVAAGLAIASNLSAPDSARADPAECEENRVCLWGDASYHGRAVFVPDGLLAQENLGEHNMNDLTTSIWNRTGYTICFYEHIHYQGAAYCIAPWDSTPALPGGWNDRISSMKPL